MPGYRQKYYDRARVQRSWGIIQALQKYYDRTVDKSITIDYYLEVQEVQSQGNTMKLPIKSKISYSVTTDPALPCKATITVSTNNAPDGFSLNTEFFGETLRRNWGNPCEDGTRYNRYREFAAKAENWHIAYTECMEYYRVQVTHLISEVRKIEFAESCKPLDSEWVDLDTDYDYCNHDHLAYRDPVS